MVLAANGQEIATNAELILHSLANDYRAGPAWIFDDLSLSVWENNCAVLQWTKHNIFCHIYPNSVSIAKLTLIPPKSSTAVQNYDEYEQEFEIDDSKEVTGKFRDAFALIFLRI
jgi:hypothetical protein